MKTSELTGLALDWAVALAEDRVMNEPPTAQSYMVEDFLVPFQLWDVECTYVGEELTKAEAKPITVLSYGLHNGGSVESILFKALDGGKCYGSVDMFYMDKEAAELAAKSYLNGTVHYFHPSEDWSQGGPIIGREKISVIHCDHLWRATNGPNVTEEAYSFTRMVAVSDPETKKYLRHEDAPGQADEWGLTPLIAAMRCYVASKLGDEVDIPQEVLNENV